MRNTRIYERRSQSPEAMDPCHGRCLRCLRTIVAALLAARVLAGFDGDPLLAAGRDAKPNVIFILADDLGYADLGCYGQKDIQTPHLDRLAAQGTRFHQVYAGAAVCAPSRGVLMTGLHTGHARVRDNQGRRSFIPAAERGQSNRIPLEPEDVTVAEVLKPAGYATAIFGKWGLGEPGSTGVPNRQGFDEWLGFLNQDHADDYYTSNLWQNGESLPIKGNQDGQRSQYVHDLFAERALRFIEKSKERPFFLYLAFTIPHKNFEVPGLGQYADMPWTAFEKTYAAMVSRMDGDVGRLVKLLDDLRLAGDTIIFFSSDNGAPDVSASSRFRSTPGFRGRKGSFYEGGIRTPMIVRWPGRVTAGAVSSQVWYFADFLPTAAELAGAKIPPGLDGVSLVPTLLGRPQDLSERFLYWENPGSQAARQGNWKGVRAKVGQPIELYDLLQDPGETNNLAAQRPEIAARFETYLKNARTPSPHYRDLFSSDEVDRR